MEPIFSPISFIQSNEGNRTTNILCFEERNAVDQRPFIEEQMQTAVIARSNEDDCRSIRCSITVRKQICFQFGEGCTKIAIQKFQANVIKFQQAKSVWVTKACNKIVNLTHNVLLESNEEYINLQNPDVLSIKIMNPQFPTTNLLEPNTKIYTFRRSQLFQLIDSQIDTKITFLTETQLVYFRSLLDDIARNLFSSLASRIILSAESVWTLHLAKTIHTFAMETLIEAEQNQPTLFNENLLFYWEKGI